MRQVKQKDRKGAHRKPQGKYSYSFTARIFNFNTHFYLFKWVTLYKKNKDSKSAQKRFQAHQTLPTYFFQSLIQNSFLRMSRHQYKTIPNGLHF